MSVEAGTVRSVDVLDRPPVAWVGVDWGTHSSKWAYYRGEALNRPVVGPIRASNLIRIENNLIFSPTGDHLRRASPIRSIKKLIIADPAGPFWEGVRDDTQTTLGEAVVFSLCSLLADLRSDLAQNGIEFYETKPLDVGFSLPNWVEENDEAQRVGLNRFHQAVMVALDLFVRLATRELPQPGKQFPIRAWREMVCYIISRRRERQPVEWGQESKGISVESLVRKDVYDFGVLRYSYIVESCAAGLPYLRAMGDPLSGSSPRIRKLLVVDVGAGSTDIGYMLRTVSINKEWVMNYFTPGDTHGIAGDNLTERIRRQLLQQGRVVGFDEAQAEKERGIGSEWQVTKDWIQIIARHSADYIAGVRDTIRLPSEPPLEIVLTGGSGPTIPGLAEAIRDHATEALRARGMGAIAERTKIADVVLPQYGLPDIEAYARRIVSIGAADPEKPKLRHKESLEASRGPGVEVVTWRGSGG